jgi:hypothetical protein
MFEENENPVIEDITENVEETTEELTDGAKDTVVTDTVEETPKGKFYTDEEIKNIKLRYGRRVEDKVRKDFDKKYGNLENVLRAGTGEEDIDKITDAFTTYYETKKGIKIPKTPQYSDRDMEYLAERDANEIIEGGYDEIKDELNRLSDIGFDNMSKSDKHIFLKLKQEADRITNERELASIGVTELPDDFKDFAKKFSNDLSMKEKYEMYTKLNPKKEVKPMGSMKSGQMNTVKDYYTEDEIAKMSLDDLNDPQVWEAVRKSMTGQS